METIGMDKRFITIRHFSRHERSPRQSLPTEEAKCP
jgi:hypothetical protein